MQTRSINQINGRLTSSPDINFYLKLSEEQSKYKNIGWRGKYFNYKFTYDSGRVDIRNITPIGNFIYLRASNAMHDIAQVDRHRYIWNTVSKSANYSLEFQDNTIVIGLKLSLEMTGVYLQVSAERRDRAEYFMPLKREVFKVRSNETIDNINLVAYFERNILPKFFHAPGIFRNIQIYYGIDKKAAIQKYKDLYCSKRQQPEEDQEEMRYKALTRRLSKKKNIICQDWILTERQLIQALNTEPYRRQKRELRPTPSPWALLDELSQEYDDESDLINAAMEVLSQDNILYI